MEIVNYFSTRNTGYAGTLRRNRACDDGLDVKMAKGDIRYFKSEEHPEIMLTMWYDTVIVKALSNCYKPQTVVYHIRQFNDPILKSSPLVFKEYNKKARGIDLNNQLMQQYRNLNRFDNWWMYIFFHFLNISITNAYIIYKTNILRKYRDIKRIKNRSFGLLIPRKDFILFIIRKLLNSNGGTRIKDLDKYYKTFQGITFSHYLKNLITGSNAKCMVCRRTKNSNNVFICYGCFDGKGNKENTSNFCVECFESYHKVMFKKKGLGSKEKDILD